MLYWDLLRAICESANSVAADAGANDTIESMADATLRRLGDVTARMDIEDAPALLEFTNVDNQFSRRYFDLDHRM